MNNSFSRDVIKYFWQKIRHEKWLAIGISTCLPLNTLSNQVLPPIILADVLNRLAKHDFQVGHIWASFGWELVAYSFLILLGSFSWRIIDAFQWRLESRVEKSIARQVFSNLLAKSAKFHANHFGGSLVSQTNKLMGGYIRFADTTVFNVMPLFFGVLFSIIVLFFVAPLFAVVLLAFIIGYSISSIYVTRKTRLLGALQATTESEQTGILADAITNVLTIKSFAGEQQEEALFAKATNNTQASLLRLGKANQRQMIYFGSMLNGINALALIVAVVSVMLFKANVAVVFLIFNYTAVIAEQLFAFSNNAIRNYNRAFGDARDMVTVLATAPDVQDNPNPEISKITNGSITFKDVTFQHADGKAPIFDNFNLHIKPGEKVGLVGHSGSGKTTFTRLLLRFADIQSGSIMIDSQNIANIKQNDLRKEIAYVPQEPLLFHRSIRENIAYSQIDADNQTIENVARLAHADEFIQLLPQKYDTLVGERGIKLSGGQRQRIAIARAILKNAPILLLDEATSALDSESENLIQDALWKLMQNRTAVVIAHRLSTIQKMDRIIVLENGQIAEEGTHKQLVNKTDGVYAKLWTRQSGGFLK